MATLRRYTTTGSVILLLLMGASSVPAKSTIDSQGTAHVIALFAKFADEAGQTTPPADYEDLFNPNRPGSFTHFYNEMSLGKFTIQGEVLPTYYTSDHRASAYPRPANRNEGYYGTFNLEVLRKADRDVDFSRYDHDGDGYVDFLFILVESKPAGFLPRNGAGIANLGLEEDFVTNDPGSGGPIKIAFDRGATLRGVWSFGRAVAVMAHEFGHALGLPDLYDESYRTPEDDAAGIGTWGLMGQAALGWDRTGNGGPVPFCAWSRERLGWVQEIVEITDDAVGQVFTDVATTGILYKIPLGKAGSYYLIENRQSSKSYYDRDIPQNGLLIWHIQPFQLGGNKDERNKMVDLVCADGLYEDRGYPDGTAPAPDSGRDNLDFWAHDEAYTDAHNGNWGDATDVFDGVQFTAFTPHTNPKSEGGVWMQHIRGSGTDMIADIRVAVQDGESGNSNRILDSSPTAVTPSTWGQIKAAFQN